MGSSPFNISSNAAKNNQNLSSSYTRKTLLEN